jgi:hypothetical protein
MFDEASDINMHANLNVFVNVLTDDGTVQTLTLALVEIEAGDAGTISVLLLFVQIDIILAFFTLLRSLDTVYGTLMRVLIKYLLSLLLTMKADT